MHRAILSSAGISALIVALLSLKPHQLPIPTLTGAASKPTTIASPHITTSAPPGKSTPPGRSAQPGKSTPPGRSAGTGTFTGDAIDTQYGPVQVAATLTQGKLTSVRVLLVPDQAGRDQQIAAYAVPRLTQEALDAQSAHIDSVSGASYTSQGYLQSLQSALDKAGA